MKMKQNAKQKMAQNKGVEELLITVLVPACNSYLLLCCCAFDYEMGRRAFLFVSPFRINNPMRPRMWAIFESL